MFELIINILLVAFLGFAFFTHVLEAPVPAKVLKNPYALQPDVWPKVIIILLGWFGFLCMSIETYNDTNIAVSGFYKNFPKPVQKACDVLRHVLMAVFFWLMESNAYKIFLVNSRKRLPASHWNQGLQYFPMVLGGALMLVFSIINIIGALINEKRELTSDTVVIEEKREGGEEA